MHSGDTFAFIDSRQPAFTPLNRFEAILSQVHAVR